MIVKRRTFLKSGSLAIAAQATGAPQLLALAVDDGHSIGRTVYPLNTGWLWSRDQSEQLHARSVDESGFAEVILPHTNTFIPWHNVDQTSYQCTSTYRRHFKLPQTHRGQRIFIDFEAAMTASRVWLNGQFIGEYMGGFTPFSFELTKYIDWSQENVVAVDVDSRELPEIPPFGYEIDYLTYGGIYREASIRCVPTTFIDKVKISTDAVLTENPTVEVALILEAGEKGNTPDTIEAAIFSSDATGSPLAISTHKWSRNEGGNSALLHINSLPTIQLWQLDAPHLYTMRVRLLHHGTVIDEQTHRFGFREARFTPKGFELNGKIIKLRGLNRHQSFPFAGPAMPGRVQRKDAAILKHELKCNIVRCSHYPQSRHFLDACDELGLLVIDETPGWQHVGESKEWQERYLDNTRRMIERDWNHPSVILWSVRVNESRDFHDLYVKANAQARSLDPARQTTGVRYFQESELLEDVFSMNDFTFPLKTPNHPLYLNTEFVGAEYPVRSSDDNAKHKEHILRYARIYDQLASSPAYAGGLGWCAFDYHTHADFGSGDHICYHGVMDIFRNPKPAAGFYRSQCSPVEEPVLEAGFHFAENDEPGGFKNEVICSNCDEIQCSIVQGDVVKPVVRLHPARDQFPHLDYPPFFLTLPDGNDVWGDLRLEGFVAGKLVITKTHSGKGIDQRFEAIADDTQLLADGSDATRVTMRVTDEYGAIRPLCDDPVVITVEGPATLLGTSPGSLQAGATSVWVRATTTPGTVTVTATHSQFGTRKLQIATLARARPEI